MSQNEELEHIKNKLIEVVGELDSKHTTSMSLYNTYWHARTLLRSIALSRYSEVLEHYEKTKTDPAFPMEGYEEIFKDSHEMIDIMLRYTK